MQRIKDSTWQYFGDNYLNTIKATIFNLNNPLWIIYEFTALTMVQQEYSLCEATKFSIKSKQGWLSDKTAEIKYQKLGFGDLLR